MRYKVPETMKYFCQSEAIAYYLQKYVVYRKRKIYVGQKDFADMAPLIKKFKDDQFLLPASDKLNDDVPQTLNDLGVNWTQGIFFRTAMSDLSDLKDRSEEHTSELQSRPHLVCRLLLEKKKKKNCKKII